MKIAIEATATCRPVRTGVARYTIRLLDAMLTMAAEGAEDEIFAAYRLSRLRKRRLCYMPPGTRTLWIQEPFWPLFPGVDVVHGTDARVPNWHGAARVATIHDMGVHLFPEFSSSRFRATKIGECARMAASCHKVIADSAATRADFLRFNNFPPEDVVVVPLGVEEAFRPHGPEELEPVKAAYGLGEPYLLYVGEISRRKNAHRLLEAYASSALKQDFALVLAGSVDTGMGDPLEIVSALGIERRVRLLGYVPDAHLPPLYAGAAAFVFPTVYEGFGLPVLEAMASGIPVVGGNQGAVPEFAQGHAVLVDPSDPAAIAAGMARAVELGGNARETARAQALTFTWERCARATRQVYSQALERKNGP